MDVVPSALYSSLLCDLSPYIPIDLLKVYLKRKDLPVGASPKEVAAISIARSLLKKYRYASNDQRDSAALLKFLKCNKACGDWRLQLDDSRDEELWGEFRQALWEYWHVDKDVRHPLVEHHYDILERGGVGPGSAIGGRGGDFYTKLFSSGLSCTSNSLYAWYKRYVRAFPEYRNADYIREASYGTDMVEGNRLTFVPKNDETSRTICVEPTLNMFYQIGFGRILEQRLEKRFGIKLPIQQSKNRELARRGSVTDGFATIDLESASDSISRKMLQAALPSDWLCWLEKLRSPSTEVPGLGCIQTDMVSTMGNGFTFPLQTVLFTCAVVAAAKFCEVKLTYPRGSNWGSFGVNGDDIVVESSLHRTLVRLLNIMGFTVNSDKTFVEGPFRESCGGDFYMGYHVRGVYVKSLASPQDRYVAINQLNQFSTRTGIFLPLSVQYLLKTVRWLPVPRWENDSAGIRLPSSLVRELPSDHATGSKLYWRWEPDPHRIRISDSAIVVPRGSKSRIYNPSGLLLSFLQRSVNSSAIGVRHDVVRYRRRRCIAPNWDSASASSWVPNHGAEASVDANLRIGIWDWRWETALYMNATA